MWWSLKWTERSEGPMHKMLDKVLQNLR